LKNRADNNERAMAEIGQVRELFDQGQYQAAIDGVPERNIPGLKSIVDNYGNSKGGDLARFLLASAYYDLGKYDEALAQFEAFSPSDELLATSRYAGIAQCYEGKKNYSEAAGYFEKAGGKYPKEVTAAENLNNAARNYALAGNKEKSLELYKRLKKDYPTSQYARDADRFIAELSL
jgi:TolA-binding protein